MMKKIIGLIIVCYSVTTLASSIKTVGHEASEAVRHLSLCGTKLSRILNNDSWVGKTELWENINGDYGYIFHIFRSNINFETKKVGTVEISGEVNSDLATDGSSYRYACNVLVD